MESVVCTVEKECCRCQKVKPATEFHRHKPSPDGLKAACKACREVERRRSLDQERRRDRERYRRDRAKRLAGGRRYRYGITDDAYQAMLLAQDGKCAICPAVLGEGRIEGPNIDHCHATGRVRGLLCMRCNRALGMFRDDPEVLRSAAIYLERAREVSHG